MEANQPRINIKVLGVTVLVVMTAIVVIAFAADQITRPRQSLENEEPIADYVSVLHVFLGKE